MKNVILVLLEKGVEILRIKFRSESSLVNYVENSNDERYSNDNFSINIVYD